MAKAPSFHLRIVSLNGSSAFAGAKEKVEPLKMAEEGLFLIPLSVVRFAGVLVGSAKDSDICLDCEELVAPTQCAFSLREDGLHVTNHGEGNQSMKIGGELLAKGETRRVDATTLMVIGPFTLSFEANTER